MKPIKKILIVCTGNSCRSVMAEGYLTKRLKESGVKNVMVISSGTYATPGLKPTPEAIQVMKENDIDISGYASSNLIKGHIDSADIILVMEPHHKEKVLNLSPDAEKKIHLLRSFSAENPKLNKSIKDPIGEPVETYREIFEIIKDSTDGFLKWLQE